jgi:predicted DCC family thiol-disulfide oxidoreductase YuxK
VQLVGSEDAPLLIYDGDCAFCSSSARWLSAHWHGQQKTIPWQHLDSDDFERLGLTIDDARQAAWWIDTSGGRSRGHRAIGRALGASDGWPSVVGRIVLAPPFRWLAAGAYPLVARWRHRLPGGTPACRR